jgi:predicted DNA-binding transcriptional regulator YafY
MRRPVYAQGFAGKGDLMAGKECAKDRILAIERMFQTGNPLTTREIIEKLSLQYDIEVERKTVYDDIAVLTRYMMIEQYGVGRGTYYQLATYER